MRWKMWENCWWISLTILWKVQIFFCFLDWTLKPQEWREEFIWRSSRNFSNFREPNFIEFQKGLAWVSTEELPCLKLTSIWYNHPPMYTRQNWPKLGYNLDMKVSKNQIILLCSGLLTGTYHKNPAIWGRKKAFLKIWGFWVKFSMKNPVFRSNLGRVGAPSSL